MQIHVHRYTYSEIPLCHFGCPKEPSFVNAQMSQGVLFIAKLMDAAVQIEKL